MPGEPLVLPLGTAARFGFCSGPKGQVVALFSWNVSPAGGLLTVPGSQAGAGWQGAPLEV